MQEFHFPNWINKVLIGGLAVGGLVGGYLAICLFGAVHPTTVNIGYQPTQPVPFSHKLHAGTLKLDCRYCHNTVEQAGHAAIPPTATCGNCHGGNRVKTNAKGEKVALSVVHPESDLLTPVRNSLETKMPVEWVRVHNLPDFVYFNHSAHINRGVSCVSCHDRIDKMEVVQRSKPLSMKWCLDCHRNPDEHIRPRHLVTQLDWNPDPEELSQVFFASLDQDANSGLTEDEAQHAFVLPGMDLADVAGDEFQQQVETRFERADVDQDGRLSAEELAGAIGSISRQRLGTALRSLNGIQPNTNCSTCHR